VRSFGHVSCGYVWLSLLLMSLGCQRTLDQSPPSKIVITSDEPLEATCCALSPDQKLLVVGLRGRLYRDPDFADPGAVVIIDTKTFTVIHKIEVRIPVSKIAFSPEGQSTYVATGGAHPELYDAPLKACRDCAMGQVICFSTRSWKRIATVPFPGTVLDVTCRSNQVFVTGAISLEVGFAASLDADDLSNSQQTLEVTGTRQHLSFVNENVIHLRSMRAPYDQFVYLQEDFANCEVSDVLRSSPDRLTDFVFGADHDHFKGKNYSIRKYEGRDHLKVAVGEYEGQPSWFILADDKLLMHHPRGRVEWPRQIAVDTSNRRAYVASSNTVECVEFNQ